MTPTTPKIGTKVAVFRSTGRYPGTVIATHETRCSVRFALKNGQVKIIRAKVFPAGTPYGDIAYESGPLAVCCNYQG